MGDRREGGQVPLKSYVDERLTEVRHTVDRALAFVETDGVPLREFVEAIMEEQRRGMIVAEQEREKAAHALRVELDRAIQEGDRALRDHIGQQINQVREALVSADLLEVARVSAITARVESVNASALQHVEQLRRERELVTAGQMEAIAKAESATEKRFESVNEFRAQLSDTIAQFLPREVAETQLTDVRKTVIDIDARAMNKETFEAAAAAYHVWRGQVDERLNRMAGASESRHEQRAGVTVNVQLLLAALSIIVVVLVANHVFG